MLFVRHFLSQQSKPEEEKVQVNTKDKVIQSPLVKVEKAILRVGALAFALNIIVHTWIKNIIVRTWIKS